MLPNLVPAEVSIIPAKIYDKLWVEEIIISAGTRIRRKIMELNQGDIQNLMVVIDLATQRGVFKASDLVAIGQLYEKLNGINKNLVEEQNKKQPE
ncbi:hypothetical protein EB118_12695 [bacterium]|nr:hypothetical protein [bacterium]